MNGDVCFQGHSVPPGTRSCPVCGAGVAGAATSTADGDGAATPGRRGGARRALVLAAAAAAVVGGAVGGAYALGRQSGPSDSTEATPPSATRSTPSSEEPEPVGTSRPVPTVPPIVTVPSTTATTVIRRTPPTTVAPYVQAARDEAAAARSAVIVYYTAGVEADGFPALHEIVAPEAIPAVASMTMRAEYRNAGCSQVVTAINPRSGYAAPTYRFGFNFRYRCPAGAPTVGGAPLPLEVPMDAVVTMAPKPGGGYWATEVRPL